MFLISEIADKYIAVRLTSVQEVVPMASLIAPPECPDFLEGFLNLRGSAVAVIRMARLFGLHLSPGLHTPLVVLRTSVRPTALLVERVAGIFPAESIVPLPLEESINGCLESNIVAGGYNAVLLSIERLLIEQERQSITALSARLDERILAAGRQNA